LLALLGAHHILHVSRIRVKYEEARKDWRRERNEKRKNKGSNRSTFVVLILELLAQCIQNSSITYSEVVM
jgi:hypothetical protein